MEKHFKYIYGPVPSWRLGSSLGLDLLSQADKVCDYDCIYCQLGPTESFTGARRLYVDEDMILKELDMLPDHIPIDYITLSGRGEPTLAANLGNIIEALRKNRKEPIAVITNSSQLYLSDVREELSSADFVMAKLDASSQASFEAINRPMEGIMFDAVMKGIEEFKRGFRGRFALQIMFMEGNKHRAGDIAEIAQQIGPHEVQINTPLRPCGFKPIKAEELSRIKDLFSGLNTISVYESRKRHVKPISDEDTLRRRGKG